MEENMETTIWGYIRVILGLYRVWGLGFYMSYSLNSLQGSIYGTTIGVIEGDTRSLDNGLRICKKLSPGWYLLVYGLGLRF